MEDLYINKRLLKKASQASGLRNSLSDYETSPVCEKKVPSTENRGTKLPFTKKDYIDAVTGRVPHHNYSDQRGRRPNSGLFRVELNQKAEHPRPKHNP